MSANAAPVETARSASPKEMRVYSHTGLLYWWPVWAVGLAMAMWTLTENRHMALVAAGTVVEGNTLVSPSEPGPVLIQTHVSASRVPGAVFVATFLERCSSYRSGLLTKPCRKTP